MGGKSQDVNTASSGLTPYARNLFGGSDSSTTTNSGPSKSQQLGQQIMKASNAYSASQGGPEEQAIANIGNALVSKFNEPKPVSTTPNLFGGPTPTFTPQTPITSPMQSGNPFAPGTPMPMYKPPAPTGLQMNHPITSPMMNPGSTGLQMNSPITSPMMNPPMTSPMGTPMPMFKPTVSTPVQSSPANRAPTLFGN
jgi:hypothetical protein